MYHCNLNLTVLLVDAQVVGKAESSPSVIAACSNFPVVCPSIAERLALGDDGTLETADSIEASLVGLTTHDIVSILSLRFAA